MSRQRSSKMSSKMSNTTTTTTTTTTTATTTRRRSKRSRKSRRRNEETNLLYALRAFHHSSQLPAAHRRGGMDGSSTRGATAAAAAVPSSPPPRAPSHSGGGSGAWRLSQRPTRFAAFCSLCSRPFRASGQRRSAAAPPGSRSPPPPGSRPAAHPRQWRRRLSARERQDRGGPTLARASRQADGRRGHRHPPSPGRSWARAAPLGQQRACGRAPATHVTVWSYRAAARAAKPPGARAGAPAGRALQWPENGRCPPRRRAQTAWEPAAPLHEPYSFGTRVRDALSPADCLVRSWMRWPRASVCAGVRAAADVGSRLG